MRVWNHFLETELFGKLLKLHKAIYEFLIEHYNVKAKALEVNTKKLYIKQNYHFRICFLNAKRYLFNFVHLLTFVLLFEKISKDHAMKPYKVWKWCNFNWFLLSIDFWTKIFVDFHFIGYNLVWLMGFRTDCSASHRGA